MNSENLVYESDLDLALKIRKHKKIKKKCNLFKKSGKSKDKYRVSFKKGDMFGAFHDVDLFFEKYTNGAISCELVDTYNFKYEEPKSFIMVANNYAYVSQQIGTLHKYKITVKMWMQKLSLSFTSRLRRAKWRKK